jgi:AcrR family transcriptional regulator
MTDFGHRRLRADAQRNRDRILTAARVAFSEVGPSVPADEIARRADVSTMTLYRHFPNRDELVAAVIERGIAEDVDPVIAAALVNPDPWQGLVDVIGATVHSSTSSPAWRETLAAAREVGLTDYARDRIFEPVSELLSRAQDSGEVRADIAATDIPPIVGMLRFFAITGDASTADAWLRYFSLMLRVQESLR